jgi:hypothetical protein
LHPACTYRFYWQGMGEKCYIAGETIYKSGFLTQGLNCDYLIHLLQ